MLKQVAIALFIVLCQPVKADVLEINRAGPTCDKALSTCTLVVQIRGEVTDLTLSQFGSLINSTKRKAEGTGSVFGLFLVELNSPGGSVDAAMEIGRIVRQEGSSAVVNRGAVCLSACVLILAGASFRGLEGKIGIHRPYFSVPSGELSPEAIKTDYQKMLREIRAYLLEMNVAEGLADAMLRINPENMQILSKQELLQYGLTAVDPIALETFELERAKSFGLDRQEYMRRKLLAEAQCGGPASLGTACYVSVLKTGTFEQPDFSKYGRPLQ